MIRLIHLAEYSNPHPGSFVPLLLAIYERAASRGWELDACFTEGVDSSRWAGALEERGVRVRMIPRGSRRELAARLEEILAESELPTVIHTHFTTYDVAAVVAARRRGDCAVFWHIHTVLGTGPRARLRNALKFASFGRRVDGIFVPAEDVGDALARRLAPRDRIMLVPSPIDPGEFRPPTPDERHQARRELGVPEGSASLLHIGRAWTLKGGDIYFQAVRELLDQGLALTAFTLRGGEPAAHEAERLGLGDNARVLGPVKEITALYAAMDCFVAPSRGEGMPFSIVEALASGIPVVASDHLSGHRYLGDRIEACATVPGNPASIAAGVRAMLERPAEQAAREAEQARSWIVANLNLEVAAERLVDAYEDALARGLVAPAGP